MNFSRTQTDRKMENVDGIIVNYCTSSSRTNGNVFNSTWSSGGHINSVIRLMGDWLNEHAIKKPLVTQLMCHRKPMLLDRDMMLLHTQRAIWYVTTHKCTQWGGDVGYLKALSVGFESVNKQDTAAYLHPSLGNWALKLPTDSTNFQFYPVL